MFLGLSLVVTMMCFCHDVTINSITFQFLFITSVHSPRSNMPSKKVSDAEVGRFKTQMHKQYKYELSEKESSGRRFVKMKENTNKQRHSIVNLPQIPTPTSVTNRIWYSTSSQLQLSGTPITTTVASITSNPFHVTFYLTSQNSTNLCTHQSPI